MSRLPYEQQIATELNIKSSQVSAVIELLDDGNTLPFIARYRKERTESLDEDQLRNIIDMLERLRAMDKRRDAIIASIEEQEQMTPELMARIESATTMTELEDLYLPYKKKRKTRASVARERGLQGLADLIIQQIKTNDPLEKIAKPYLNDDVPTIGDAYDGARDIVAETINDHAEIRGEVRQKALQWGLLQCVKIDDADDPKNVYKIYYEFEQRVDRLQHYQILAINRGETEKILRVKVDLVDRDWLKPIQFYYRAHHASPLAEQLEMAIADCAKRLLLPAIERDVRRELTEQAETHAINVFATNLRGLLSQPPLTGHVILGLDPAYRTGCKVTVIDPTGKVLHTETIYPHAPQNQWAQSLGILDGLIKQFGVTLIAIGNGTASRETEQLAAELIRERDDVHYLIVNEAGASVYSASPLARSEFPDLDVSLRGAVSIARRVQDPLAELVKIDPKSIGVGLYQHDVNQQKLSDMLDGVVESVVNQVGIDLNTASPALLRYVAGVGPKLAENIVAYRDENGRFDGRSALKNVAGLGPKAFEQSAGFLRVNGGKDPLDASAIHPESYKIAKQIVKKVGLTLNEPLETREQILKPLKQTVGDLAQELGTGVPTLQDIFEQLVRPGRDPREDAPTPILRSDVLSMADLQVGMVLNGTVRNVVDFGAFVDIGVKQDGLLHRSQLPRGTQIGVGDIIEVELLSIDADRGRIGLTWVKS